MVAQFGSPTRSSALPLTRGSVTGRAIVDRKTIHVHDLAAMVETEYPDVKEVQQRIGHRTTLATPLLSQGEALGAISVRKNHVHPFSDRQITLLQTFADQAVIAIENARLFEQVQARTHELSDALSGRQRRAKSQCYQPVARPAAACARHDRCDREPVMQGRTCCRLQIAEGKYYLAAASDADLVLIRHGTEHPIAPARGSLVGRTALEGKTIHLPDCLADPEFTLHDLQRMAQVSHHARRSAAA